jgi:hypothetical protein
MHCRVSACDAGFEPRRKEMRKIFNRTGACCGERGSRGRPESRARGRPESRARAVLELSSRGSMDLEADIIAVTLTFCKKYDLICK